MVAKFIAVVNQKGGVGKTTSAVNIAAIAARLLGAGRVLLLDADPQSNSTVALLSPDAAFGDRSESFPTLLDVLEGRCELNEAVHPVTLAAVGDFGAGELDVIPARLELAALEAQLNSAQNLFTLRRKANTIRDRYDLVIIDTPPNIGGYMMNILMVATHIVIPVTPGIYEIIGLNSLLDTIEPVIDELNPNLQIVGILPTRVKRTRFAKDGVTALRKRFGEELILPIIGDRVVIERAHMHGQDVFSYEPDSDGAQMYLEATRKLLTQIGLVENSA